MAVPTLSTPAPSAKRRGVLLPISGLVVLALCGLITIGLVERSVGPFGLLVGILCAMLPVVPVLATFLWVDRWEPSRRACCWPRSSGAPGSPRWPPC